MISTHGGRTSKAWIYRAASESAHRRRQQCSLGGCASRMSSIHPVCCGTLQSAAKGPRKTSRLQPRPFDTNRRHRLYDLFSAGSSSRHTALLPSSLTSTSAIYVVVSRVQPQGGNDT